jgi:hypothetical protein
MTMARSLAWVGVPALGRTVSGNGIRPFNAAQWIRHYGTLCVINSGELSSRRAAVRAAEKAHRDCVLTGPLTPFGRIPNSVLFVLDEVTQTLPCRWPSGTAPTASSAPT